MFLVEIVDGLASLLVCAALLLLSEISRRPTPLKKGNQCISPVFELVQISLSKLGIALWFCLVFCFAFL